MICLIWKRPGLVSRLPDTVWTCCGGLLMIVFRLILTVVLLHSATLQMEILAFIDFKIGTDFFLTVTYYTMRWATCTVLVHCLIIKVSKLYSDNSNTDRIIVSFTSGWKRFENIYVTQHSDQVHFDQNHTYCISIDLLKNIQDLSREEFLRGCTTRSEHISIDIPQSAQIQPLQSQSTCEECYALLTCALFNDVLLTKFVRSTFR